MIYYTDDATPFSEDDFQGFFDGWPDPPSPETLLYILKNREHSLLAVDDRKRRIVGFIYAISDNKLFAYIPMLEVLPEYRMQGVGTQLLERLTEKMKDMYSIDLCCDDKLVHFYERSGFLKVNGMLKRNCK
ncbi:GNAT family N-acetyltransferase [Spirochaeta isovalerica]|uniref:Ribosomal protein S18 acetylase RimI-like enzyme n=1 Tax=Spirochaeta isovalerica TaxID=150 RepID=A0A841RFV5_9SPIO|nr:GNAT family N-acetyltransferase [Spirochaeta isovalerica]MBB6481232.1 ribosomal protein S18 acetylase RimI-like enzyme [Spirochaeta isovalerica]